MKSDFDRHLNTMIDYNSPEKYNIDSIEKSP